MPQCNEGLASPALSVTCGIVSKSLIHLIMTLEAFYTLLMDYRFPIALLVLGAPWVTYLICHLIPGQREEPFVLSVNLSMAVVSLLLLTGYLAYATNTGGWQQVVQQADIGLLCLPPYYLITSLWLSKRRLPLNLIPAFRTLQGLVMMAAAFLVLSWVLDKVRIVFFSYLPFTTFLWLLALLVGLGYAGYRRIVG